jgi:acid stress-induced BolA-like protein IbaG/YrbA
MSLSRKIPEYLRLLFEKEAVQVRMRSTSREWEKYEERLINALRRWIVNDGQPSLIEIRQIQNEIAVGLSYSIELCRIAEKEEYDYSPVKRGYDSYEYDCYEEQQLMSGTRWSMIKENWRLELSVTGVQIERERDTMCMLVCEGEHIPYEQQTKGQRELTDMENAMIGGMAQQKNFYVQGDQQKLEPMVVQLQIGGGEQVEDQQSVCEELYDANTIAESMKNSENDRQEYLGEIEYDNEQEFDCVIDIRRPVLETVEVRQNVIEARQCRAGIRKKQTKKNKLKGVLPRVFSQLTFVVLVGLCCLTMIEAGELDWTCRYEHRYTVNSAYELGTLRIEYWSMRCYKYFNSEEWCVQTQYEKHKTYLCEILDNEVCFEEIRPWYMYQVDYGEGYRIPNIVVVNIMTDREVLIYQGAELGDVDINSEVVELAEIAGMYHLSCLNGEFYELLFDRRLYYPLESVITEERCSVSGSDGGGVIYSTVRGFVSWVIGYWRD